MDSSLSTISQDERPWDIEIGPKKFFPPLRFGEIFPYWGLIWIFVYRDFVVYYKQTILGPLWWLLQPIITCGVFVVIFSTILRIGTDTVPPTLYYLSGLILWFYFSNSFTNIASTFGTHGALFGKVYFPRLVVPISLLISNLLKLGLQLSFFILVYIGYFFCGADICPNVALLFFPFVILYIAILALGFGLLFNSLTYKYRDLALMIPFIVQMWMFLSSVIHSTERIPTHLAFINYLNPVIPAMEVLRYSLFDKGTLYPGHILSGLVIGAIVLLLGLLSFAKAEQNFIDTV